MATEYKTKKRHKPNTPEINTHTDSIDPYSDATFLISYINIDDSLLSSLTSNRITNSSFSDLYRRSQKDGWIQVLIEERNNLKLDEKSKPKRFMFNRSIQECSKNIDTFNEQVDKLNEVIKSQLSDTISPEQLNHIPLQTINDVYNKVKSLRQLQCERRLFYKECDQQCSLLTLQRRMTDEFINLAKSLRNDSNFSQVDGQNALIELFKHSVIIVAQPAGTDCVAVTKYEKVGEDFLAKIKTRIICLLDPNRISEYLEHPSIDVILHPKDSELDPNGDLQSSLEWKTRTVICNENEERTFLYIESDENNVIKLTKKNSKGKLSYNNRLCQLEFRIIFKIIETNIEIKVTLNSQLFGLCSHAKYCSIYLTQVFIEEVNEMYKDVNLQSHITALEGYICRFHKRISGFEAKPHTREFIKEKLLEVYNLFQQSAASTNGPNILEKLFTQIKFLGNHPFLSMMYHDNLFLGICNDTVVKKLNNGTQAKPHVIMRFEIFKQQETTASPNIIVAINNGVLWEARITHDYFIDDICILICEAAENEQNQSEMFAYDKNLSFHNFCWYYDTDLSRDNLIQADAKTIYFPLKVVLRNTMRNNRDRTQTSNEQQNITYTFNLSGQLTGNVDLTVNAIAFLQEQLADWCRIHDVHGSLSQIPIPNEEIDVDLGNFLDENNS